MPRGQATRTSAMATTSAIAAMTVLLLAAGGSPVQAVPVPGAGDVKTEPMPILMYDTDVGVGYGAKLFLLNHLRRDESLDAIAFNSTKGQRWVRLLFSAPDFERRQGSAYRVSLDLFVDYDARIKASFFGVGPHAKHAERETYGREAVDLRATVARGFSPSVVGEAGVRYRSVRYDDFEDGSRLRVLSPGLDGATASWSSLLVSLRRDTRDSFVNPTRGLVLQGDAELALGLRSDSPYYARYAAWVRAYTRVPHTRVVLGFRLGAESVVGDDLPVQALLALGGAGTVRGLSQDRYLDRARALMNVEARIAIYGRLGAIAALDSGRVWSSVGDASLRGWETTPAVGLRYHLDTYVVRLDVGLGDETTGIYFNFGQVF
ncbi:BamA/TamA family outer membrane protein [Candidatus Poribacteria bacterium]|jgi:outer membrane protein assembly factor BamA|nr:BamA/TamA family outer membrane protein [Candidatus Poribacteria bacterium]MBT5532209.1 BamA/TamA family outer membrane protein [Candidatus Poribacteria bacterium]MBT7099981.1 BamA/TamA family outer membrane protein [Candidatus Poribacteria bacterium]